MTNNFEINLDEEYICSMCHEIYKYETTWTDDDATKEYKENFPRITEDNMSIVCDDCYQAVLER